MTKNPDERKGPLKQQRKPLQQGIRTQKEKRDEYETGPCVQGKEERSAILLLALSSNTTHEPAYAHKKADVLQRKVTQEKRGRCEGKVGIVNRTRGSNIHLRDRCQPM